jgi:ABC-type proline/glycine betaine transport system ATPase subunit
MHAHKTAFIVEHDMIMATYLADRVIVFSGQPGISAQAHAPESLLTGCNRFLKSLDITFRRDPQTMRPRVNKHQSQMDQDQKAKGEYVRWPDSCGLRRLMSASSSLKMTPKTGSPVTRRCSPIAGLLQAISRPLAAGPENQV